MAEKKAKTINDRLRDVQYELKAPKGQFNKFGGYKYRSCEDILEAAKPVLKKHGLTLTLNDAIVEVGDRIYVKARATVTDGMTNIGADAYAREAESKKGMDSSQITGMASSYARKYALNGLFLIDDTKDADSNEQHKQAQNAPKQAAPKQAPVQQAQAPDALQPIRDLFPIFRDACGYNKEQAVSSICAIVGATNMSEIAPDAVPDICARMQASIDLANEQQDAADAVGE